MWGFAPPESDAPPDEKQAMRWVADIDEKGVERINFVTGGGNDNLAKIVNLYPDKFSGFAHHSPFRVDAASELERAVKELGLKGYKIVASSQTDPIDDESLYPVWETVEDLEIIHNQMLEAINDSGGRVDKVYFCPDLAGDSQNCRKPATKMAGWAKEDYPEIDFERAVMVGDSKSDIEFGKASGMKTVFVTRDNNNPYDADSCVSSLIDFASFINQ